MLNKIRLHYKDGHIAKYRGERIPNKIYDEVPLTTRTDAVEPRDGRTATPTKKIYFELVSIKKKGFWLWRYKEAHYGEE